MTPRVAFSAMPSRRKVPGFATLESRIPNPESIEVVRVNGGPAVDAQFNLPGALWADSTGAIYIVDRGNHRIRKLQ